MAYQVVCLECGEKKVLREENTYSGRSPESVAQEVGRWHQRNHNNEDAIVIKEGSWDGWNEEFVED